MSTTAAPDWARIAAGFDLWLRPLAPVAEIMLQALAAQPGERVLDLASGTGEPALTLARRMPSVRIVGTDAAAPMVEVAARKVRQERLANVEFQAQPAEALPYADASFDRVMCRFGVMLFNDPLAGVREAYRVLKPDGTFVFAVWSGPERMTNCRLAVEAFRGLIPEDKYPPLAGVTSLGDPDKVRALVTRAGFAPPRIEEHSFDFEFDGFDAYWDMVEQSGVMAAQFEALPAPERPRMRERVRTLAAPYLCTEGLRMPHGFLLAVACKSFQPSDPSG